MKRSHKTITMDRAAILLMAGLIALTAITSAMGAQAGIRASLPDGETGPYGPVTVVFSEAVNASMIESAFTVEPEAQGSFRWVDERTLQFSPASPFQPETKYSVQIAAGVLKRAFTGSFRIRDPLIAYLVSEDGKTDLFVTDVDGRSQRNLTGGNHSILTFDASRNGNFIIFAAFNDENGIDLWRVDRTGGPAGKILACGADRCSAPAISPDGTRIAYVREVYVGAAGLPYGSPRIWLLDQTAGRDGPVYADEQILGYGPVWSPGGRYLASHNGTAAELRLLEVETGKQLLFTSETGKPFTWSPDETLFLYTDLKVQNDLLVTRVRLADLNINETFTVFGANDERDFSYNALAWSPTSEHVLLGLHAEANNPAQVFWLYDPASLDGPMIANEAGYSYSDPIWDPWGTAVIFRQFKLGEAYRGEIGIWLAADRSIRFLVNGELARWLP